MKKENLEELSKESVRRNRDKSDHQLKIMTLENSINFINNSLSLIQASINRIPISNNQIIKENEEENNLLEISTIIKEENKSVEEPKRKIINRVSSIHHKLNINKEGRNFTGLNKVIVSHEKPITKDMYTTNTIIKNRNTVTSINLRKKNKRMNFQIKSDSSPHLKSTEKYCIYEDQTKKNRRRYLTNRSII